MASECICLCDGQRIILIFDQISRALPTFAFGECRSCLGVTTASTAALFDFGSNSNRVFLKVGKCKQHEYQRKSKNLQNEIITLCTLVVWTVFYYSVIQRCVLLSYLVCSSILLVLNASLVFVDSLRPCQRE